MSEENVEIVRRVYEGVTARSKVPRELFDPDLELDQTEVPLDTGGVSRGIEAGEEVCASTGRHSRTSISMSKK